MVATEQELILDTPPDYSGEAVAEWRADKQEQFGDRWPEVELSRHRASCR